MLDDKIKMKKAVHFMIKAIIGDVFLSIFIGLFAFLFFLKWA
jgi:hypothetical protein